MKSQLERTKPDTAARQQPERPLPDLYQVVIECEGEAQQRDLYERLRAEGFTVRLLVL